MARRKILKSRPERVFKICTAADWRTALACGHYEGSADDLRDGYIHLSIAHQVAGVLARYFTGAGDLVAITLRTETLGAALRWEANRSGEEFPHFYAALPAALAERVNVVPDEAKARARFAEQLT